MSHENVSALFRFGFISVVEFNIKIKQSSQGLKENWEGKKKQKQKDDDAERANEESKRMLPFGENSVTLSGRTSSILFLAECFFFFNNVYFVELAALSAPYVRLGNADHHLSIIKAQECLTLKHPS